MGKRFTKSLDGAVYRDGQLVGFVNPLPENAWSWEAPNDIVLIAVGNNTQKKNDTRFIHLPNLPLMYVPLLVWKKEGHRRVFHLQFPNMVSGRVDIGRRKRHLETYVRQGHVRLINTENLRLWDLRLVDETRMDLVSASLSVLNVRIHFFIRDIPLREPPPRRPRGYVRPEPSRVTR